MIVLYKEMFRVAKIGFYFNIGNICFGIFRFIFNNLQFKIGAPY